MPELTYTDVRNILAIVDSSHFDELYVEFGDFKLDLRRGSAAMPVAATMTPAIAPGQVVVPAPMLGTFQRGPSPDALPFVEVGSHVAGGDPLCSIAVLDSANTVAAPIAGRIAAIFVASATMVEYGQTLMVLDPP